MALGIACDTADSIAAAGVLGARSHVDKTDIEPFRGRDIDLAAEAVSADAHVMDAGRQDTLHHEDARRIRDGLFAHHLHSGTGGEIVARYRHRTTAHRDVAADRHVLSLARINDRSVEDRRFRLVLDAGDRHQLRLVITADAIIDP